MKRISRNTHSIFFITHWFITFSNTIFSAISIWYNIMLTSCTISLKLAIRCIRFSAVPKRRKINLLHFSRLYICIGDNSGHISDYVPLNSTCKSNLNEGFFIQVMVFWPKSFLLHHDTLPLGLAHVSGWDIAALNKQIGMQHRVPAWMLHHVNKLSAWLMLIYADQHGWHSHPCAKQCKTRFQVAVQQGALNTILVQYFQQQFWRFIPNPIILLFMHLQSSKFDKMEVFHEGKLISQFVPLFSPNPINFTMTRWN